MASVGHGSTAGTVTFFGSFSSLSKKKWEEIQEGKTFKKNGKGYFGEGSEGRCKWQDRWSFDKRELIVTSTAIKNPHEVMESFIGPIEEIYVEEVENS